MLWWKKHSKFASSDIFTLFFLTTVHPLFYTTEKEQGQRQCQARQVGGVCIESSKRPRALKDYR